MYLYIQILMSVIVVVLAIYALSLCIQLFRLKRRVAEQAMQAAAQKDEQQKQSDKKRVEAQESIDILLRCLLQDQLTITEAAIRISGLAKVLKLSEVEQQFYIPFDDLAMATSHIPILADWGRLSSKEQQRFNIERETIESEYKLKILAAAKQLNKPQ